MDIDYFLSQLSENSIVLDLGCGPGSFHYATIGSRIVAMDIAFPESGMQAPTPKTHYIRAGSNAIPLASETVDVVFCHHALEHFPDYRATLLEIGRILAPDGWLWIAVPNGYGFDDALYRYLYSGGGHVNRFSHRGLVEEVHETTGLQLVKSCDLFSGFVYLKKPAPEKLQHLPRTARALANIPDGFSIFGALAVNTGARIVDRLFGTQYSQYGWGFVFARKPLAIDRLPSYFNVCRDCGSGLPVHDTGDRAGPSVFGLQLYRCPCCAQMNVFVPPPADRD